MAKLRGYAATEPGLQMLASVKVVLEQVLERIVSTVWCAEPHSARLLKTVAL